jgi:hypothetical protein
MRLLPSRYGWFFTKPNAYAAASIGQPEAKSWVGWYVLKGSELVLTRPNQADVVMQIVLRSDDLSLSTGGRTTTYRRDHAGPWYDRERIVR